MSEARLGQSLDGLRPRACVCLSSKSLHTGIHCIIRGFGGRTYINLNVSVGLLEAVTPQVGSLALQPMEATRPLEGDKGLVYMMGGLMS